MTILGKTTKQIISRLGKFSFSQKTVDSSAFNLLNNRKKANYIHAIEQVHFSFSLFFSFIDSVNFSFDKLEALKETFDVRYFGKISFEESSKRNKEVVLAWQYFFLLITTLLSTFKEYPNKKNPLLSEKDFCSEYPELNYCRFLRNDFIQHPSLLLPLHSHQTVYSPSNPDFLPYCAIGPTGDGLVIYFTYFQGKIGKKFCQLSDDEKREKNKRDYLNTYGWKPAKLRPVNSKGKTKKEERDEALLIRRIKGFGLPPPDQNKLALELTKMFDKVVFPYLRLKVRQGKKWNLFGPK